MSKINDFEFSKWINDAFLSVAKKAIRIVEKKQDTSGYSFYITFVTADKNVIIPEFLLEEYPDFMTIVLENQFSGLRTDKNGFIVTLSFKGISSDLYIPWNSIVSFVEKGSDLQMIFKYSPNFRKGYDNKKNVAKGEDKINKSKKSSKKKSTKEKESSNIIEFFPN